MHVAAADLGTSSTRLLLADVVEGRLDVVVGETRITSLLPMLSCLSPVRPAPPEHLQRRHVRP